MAVSRGLRRLLRVRELKEEQGRQALESALGELHTLERALAATEDRDRGGRSMVAASAGTGELKDRLAGLEESRTASRVAAVLVPRIQETEKDVAALREEFLGMRVERRQAETLLEEAAERESVEAGRRGQQELDDWHRNRRYREGVRAARGPERAADQSGEGGLPQELEQGAENMREKGGRIGKEFLKRDACPRE